MSKLKLTAFIEVDDTGVPDGTDMAQPILDRLGNEMWIPGHGYIPMTATCEIDEDQRD